MLVADFLRKVSKTQTLITFVELRIILFQHPQLQYYLCDNCGIFIFRENISILMNNSRGLMAALKALLYLVTDFNYSIDREGKYFSKALSYNYVFYIFVLQHTVYLVFLFL